MIMILYCYNIQSNFSVSITLVKYILFKYKTEETNKIISEYKRINNQSMFLS